MNPLAAGLSLIGDLLGFGADYVRDKRVATSEKRQIEHSEKMDEREKIHQRNMSSDMHAGELDLQSLKDRSWKDDWLLFITTLPMAIMVLEPIVNAIFSNDYVAGSAIEAVKLGFEALSSAPEYYWGGLGMIYVDTFGFRRMFRTLIDGYVLKLKKNLQL